MFHFRIEGHTAFGITFASEDLAREGKELFRQKVVAARELISAGVLRALPSARIEMEEGFEFTDRDPVQDGYEQWEFFNVHGSGDPWEARAAIEAALKAVAPEIACCAPDGQWELDCKPSVVWLWDENSNIATLNERELVLSLVGAFNTNNRDATADREDFIRLYLLFQKQGRGDLAEIVAANLSDDPSADAVHDAEATLERLREIAASPELTAERERLYAEMCERMNVQRSEA